MKCTMFTYIRLYPWRRCGCLECVITNCSGQHIQFFFFHNSVVLQKFSHSSTESGLSILWQWFKERVGWV